MHSAVIDFALALIFTLSKFHTASPPSHATQNAVKIVEEVLNRAMRMLASWSICDANLVTLNLLETSAAI